MKAPKAAGVSAIGLDARSAKRCRTIRSASAAAKPSWRASTTAGGVPAGPVLDVAAMHRDPQALAREMVVEVEHPTAGRMSTLGLPVKFSATPGRVHGPAPLFGEHSRAILGQAGYDAAAIDDLIARGIVRETGA